MARQSEPFELANMLTALLAFPEASYEDKRVGLEINLNRRTVADLRAQDSDFARDTLSRLEGVEFKTSFRGDASSKAVQNRLGRRMDVARMFRREVRKALDGHFPDLPTGIKRYSLNTLSRYVTAEDEDQSHNFRKRWFQTTLPVLNVAIGFDLASTVRYGKEENIIFDVHDKEFVSAVLYWSFWAQKVVADNGLYRAQGRGLTKEQRSTEALSNSDPESSV